MLIFLPPTVQLLFIVIAFFIVAVDEAIRLARRL
jgi:hypothetical protein